MGQEVHSFGPQGTIFARSVSKKPKETRCLTVVVTRSASGAISWSGSETVRSATVLHTTSHRRGFSSAPRTFRRSAQTLTIQLALPGGEKLRVRGTVVRSRRVPTNLKQCVPNGFRVRLIEAAKDRPRASRRNGWGWLVSREAYRCSRCGSERDDDGWSCPSCGLADPRLEAANVA